MALGDWVTMKRVHATRGPAVGAVPTADATDATDATDAPDAQPAASDPQVLPLVVPRAA